jgi:hypothetical protein
MSNSLTNPNKSFSATPGGKRPADFSSLAYERLQPQAIGLEEVVLGAVMMDKDAISTAMEILRPESFYSPVHQTIYKAMLKYLLSFFYFLSFGALNNDFFFKKNFKKNKK